MSCLYTNSTAPQVLLSTSEALAMQGRATGTLEVGRRVATRALAELRGKEDELRHKVAAVERSCRCAPPLLNPKPETLRSADARGGRL